MKKPMGFIKTHNSSLLSINIGFILDDNDICNTTTFNRKMNSYAIQLFVEFIQPLLVAHNNYPGIIIRVKFCRNRGAIY